MKEKKTIYDVARDAGVSIATVSRGPMSRFSTS